MPKFDEAMVERLAWELFKNTQCPSLPDSEIELRTLAHPELWDSCKADAETVLTALSETHLIIEKPTGEERDAGKDLALYDAATPGPWEWTEDKWHGGYSGICGPVVDGACLEVLYPDHCNEGDDGAAWFEDLPSEADRRVLTESREIAPYWIKQAVQARYDLQQEQRLHEASQNLVGAQAARIKELEEKPADPDLLDTLRDVRCDLIERICAKCEHNCSGCEEVYPYRERLEGILAKEAPPHA
jgi:hypothetical protein